MAVSVGMCVSNVAMFISKMDKSDKVEQTVEKEQTDEKTAVMDNSILEDKETADAEESDNKGTEVETGLEI